MIIHNAISEHSAITFDHPRTYWQIWAVSVLIGIEPAVAPNGSGVGADRRSPVTERITALAEFGGE